MSTQTMDLSVISLSGRQTPPAHTNTHEHTHAHTHARTHPHAHVHTHTRTRTHTHTHTRFLLIFHSFFLFFSPHQNTHDHTTEQPEIQKVGGQVRKRLLLQLYSRAYTARFFLSSASSLLFFCVHASASPWLQNSSSKLISAPFLLNRFNLCVGCAYIYICHDIHMKIYAHEHTFISTPLCAAQWSARAVTRGRSFPHHLILATESCTEQVF